MDYAVHFLLEAMGGACICTYRFCPHRMHRAIVWFVLSAVTTILTVRLVG